jgi:hypothetical protein
VKAVTLLARLNIRQLIIRRHYFIAIALSLAGCSSNPATVDLSKIGTPPPGEAYIFIIRTSYLSYAARDLIIKVNNTEIASLPRLSYTSFLMPPGVLNLSGEGGFISWPRRELSIDIEDGKTYYISWTVKETASSALMMMLFPSIVELSWKPISKDDAQQLLKDIYYVEPTFQEIP